MCIVYINLNNLVLMLYIFFNHDKWIPFTMTWCVLRLWVEEQPTILRVAANLLNKQSQTTNKGWSTRLGVGQGSNNSSLYNLSLLLNGYMCLGSGLIFGTTKTMEKGHEIWYMEFKVSV